MNILGLHKSPWHNTGACIIQTNELDTLQISMISQERLDKKKDSRDFPELAVNACMRELNINSYEEIDLIVMDHIINKDWKLDNKLGQEQKEGFLKDFPEEKIFVINHHLAHAYSVFYSTDFEEASILVVDGRGSSKETQSLYFGDKNGIKLIDKTEKVGIGLLYAAVTQKIGFKLLQEGKTMGLAPYGKNKNIFNFPKEYDGIITDYSSVLIDGKYDFKKEYKVDTSSFSEKADAAFEIQQECEQALLHLVKYSKERLNTNNLCITGGVGLNSVSNYKILQSNIFDDVFINPACSDTGIPLGCALYGLHKINNKNKDYMEISPYLGPTYNNDEIEKAIHLYSGFDIIEDKEFKKTSELLFQNKIVAVHQGRSEMGPRALGNRSILMSPLVAENKDVLNKRVKFREEFRPFAPACLLEHASEYFEIDRESPYMLFVPNVKNNKKKIIPAVTHIDGTGRLQTLTQKRNKHFYKIVKSFYDKTNVPILLNTSFNIAGQPIVESPNDAIETFLKTDIDALLLDKYLLIKLT